MDEQLATINDVKLTGTGLGLRSAHIGHVLSEKPAVPWFEILADNHTAGGGLIPRQLAAVRSDYPITFHCVGMSLAGTEPLDFDYLRTIKRMIKQYQPTQVSDHLCFTHHGGHLSHDLLPIPYTEETLKHVGNRIQQVQDFLGMQLLVENVSSYIGFRDSSLSEAEYLAALTKMADCHLLFDVNNAYVNEVNHGTPAIDFITQLPIERVREIHLAGYEDKGDYLIDAHNNPVSESVWALFEQTIALMPDAPVLVEWDNDIPSFDVLMGEAAQAERIRIQNSLKVA